MFQAASARDQAIIDRPWQTHTKDKYWRVRFVDTGLRASVPLADVVGLVRLRHEHHSPLEDHPGLAPQEVLQHAREQPRAAAGEGPAYWCGPWRAHAWKCAVRPGDPYICDGPWNGLEVRHYTTWKFWDVGQGAGLEEPLPGLARAGPSGAGAAGEFPDD